MTLDAFHSLVRAPFKRAPLLTIMFWCAAGLSTLVPIALIWTMGSSLIRTLRLWMPLFGGLLFLQSLSGTIVTYTGRTIGLRIAADLRQRLASACSSIRPERLLLPGVEEKIARLRDCDEGLTGPTLGESYEQIGTVIPGFMGGTCALVWLIWMSPAGGAVAVLLVIVMRLSLRHVGIVSSETRKKMGTLSLRADYFYGVNTRDEFAKEVRVFELQAWASRRYRELRAIVEELADSAVRHERWTITTAMCFGMIGSGAVIYTLVWSLRSQEAGVIVGALWLLTFVAPLFSPSDLRWWIGNVTEPWSDLRSLDFASTVESGCGSDARDSDIAPVEERSFACDGLEFADLHYNYPGSHGSALKRVTLKAEAGQTIAFVGPNGSGKTTLAKVAAGVLQPTAGHVFLGDDIDGSILDDHWRSMVACAFQDFVIFPESVLENISRIETFSREEILERLSLSDGPVHECDPVGPRMSGGQAQRVAIARALARASGGVKLLILDEPTSQLDSRGEMRIFSLVSEYAHDAVKILVTHRLESVRSADMIYVFSHGEVIDHGVHDELVARPGWYRTMFRMQQADFNTARRGGASTLDATWTEVSQ